MAPQPPQPAQQQQQQLQDANAAASTSGGATAAAMSPADVAAAAAARAAELREYVASRASDVRSTADAALARARDKLAGLKQGIARLEQQVGTLRLLPHAATDLANCFPLRLPSFTRAAMRLSGGLML